MKKLYIMVLIGVLIVVTPASAYIDPGVGSFMWQMLIGFALAGTYALKKYWYKIKMYFNERKVKHE